MPEIRIRRWSKAHEVSQSRKVGGPLGWVAIPVRQGPGYCRLMGQHGAKGLGVWIALLELVANQHRDARGSLVATWEDAAIMARVPREDMAEVLPTLIDIGWVEYDESVESDQPQSPDNAPATSTLPPNDHRAGSTIAATLSCIDLKNTPPTPQGGLPGLEPEPEKPKRKKPGPQDAAARLLSNRLGSSLNVCRKQVAALVNSGWDLDRVRAAIEDHAKPAMAPWDWAKAAQGAVSGVPNFHDGEWA